jgi:hypothetical protein
MDNTNIKDKIQYKSPTIRLMKMSAGFLSLWQKDRHGAPKRRVSLPYPVKSSKYCIYEWITFSGSAARRGLWPSPHTRFLNHIRSATVARTSLDEWSARRRDFYLTTHKQTNIHALGGNRTHDRSRRAAVYVRFTPRGHWDRHTRMNTYSKFRKIQLGKKEEQQEIHYKTERCT